MSPLVWDLGHIAAFEDLWLCQRLGGLEPLEPDLSIVYDASEIPRAERGDIPYLRRDDALAFMEAVRERALGVLERDGGGPLWDMLVQHEHQHNETMLQTLQLAAPGTYSPERTPADGAGARARDARRRRRARSAWASPATASPTTTSAPRTGGPARVRDRPHPGDQRRVRRVRGGRRRHARSTGLTTVSERRVRPLPSRSTPSSTAGDARLAGTRPTPSRAGAARAFRPRRSGRRPPRSTARAMATSISSTSGPAPRGRSWATAGSGRRAGSPATPGSPPSRTASTPRCSSARTYRVLRGASWATRPSVARATFRNWDFPERRQIFAGFRCAR